MSQQQREQQIEYNPAITEFIQKIDLDNLINEYIGDLTIKKSRFQNPIVIFNFYFLIIILALIFFKINSSQESFSDLILLFVTLSALFMNVYSDPYVVTVLGLVVSVMAYNLNMEDSENNESSLLANEMIYACIIIYGMMVVINSIDRFLYAHPDAQPGELE